MLAELLEHSLGSFCFFLLKLLKIICPQVPELESMFRLVCRFATVN